jgi:dTMP kinase
LAADRAQHTATVIRPALAQGDWVVCDRYVPSSLVYQGLGRDLGVDAVAALSAAATGGLEPDVVVVVDVPGAVAAARRAIPTDRLEREDAAFHARVQAGYRDLAVTHGWRVVDGTGSVEEVAERVWAEVETGDG